MLIDTHCHLNFKEFKNDLAMVVGNAKKAGVKKFITPGVDLYFSQQAIKLAQKYPGVVFAAVGYHPYEAQRNQDVSDLEKLIKSCLSPCPIIAVGECGLDYHQYKGEPAIGKKDNQKRLLEAHLQLALKYNLPVIIHCREAFDDIFTVIDQLPSLPRAVFHCFSGGQQELRELQRRRFFAGLDGNITYSKQLQSIIPHIPLPTILLETDAPFLTPVPHRGSRNEPKYIPLIAEKIAQLHNISVSRVHDQTIANTQTLFGL